MEVELRYYYGFDKYEKLIEKLKEFSELDYEGCFYEITTQYDHPMKEKSFYNKEIDGRFRVRCSKNVDKGEAKSKISWKRRLKNTLSGKVNEEEEVELSFKYEELDQLTFLLEKVIKMKNIESYERYRNIFSNEDIEIVVDKYPFGIALEIENKSKTKNAEEMVLNWVKKLDLKPEDAFRLSWDDKYTELCRNQGVEIFKHVKFDLPMPKVIE